jgi:hypothetical protein
MNMPPSEINIYIPSTCEIPSTFPKDLRPSLSTQRYPAQRPFSYDGLPREDFSLSKIMDTDTDIDNNTSSSNKRRVAFGNVTIREYPIIVGGHPPSVTTGPPPPIAIGWKHMSSTDVSIDTFEEDKPRLQEVKRIQIDRNSCLVRVSH